MKKLFISFIAFSIVLTGCSSGPKDEKQAFIDATVEATCMIFQSDNIFDPALEDAAKAIYEDYGFDANDDETMEKLTKKYETDEDVQKAITDALEECAGDFLGELESTFGDVESLSADDTVDASSDEAVVEDNSAVEEEKVADDSTDEDSSEKDSEDGNVEEDAE